MKKTEKEPIKCNLAQYNPEYGALGIQERGDGTFFLGKRLKANDFVKDERRLEIVAMSKDYKTMGEASAALEKFRLP